MNKHWLRKLLPATLIRWRPRRIPAPDAWWISGLLALTVILLLSLPALAQSPPAARPDYVPGELLVKFQMRAGLRVQQNVVHQVGGQVKSVSPFSGVMRIQVPPGQELPLAEQLSRRPEVVYAEPNYVLVTADEPDDPFFSLQWNLHNTGQVVEKIPGLVDADIDAPEAWAIHSGGGQAIVAIGDSGIDLDHEDLVDRIWINPGEVPDNGVDDDNNGFVDDVNGWNFCADSDCSVENNNPEDDNLGSHGTHVAGIAGATGNNDTGVSGVNWRTTLMPVKVLSGRTGTVQSVADGIDYAASNGADVINLSVASASTAPCAFFFKTIQDAMVRALEQGTLVVFASGNQGRSGEGVACPAALDEAIAVGATTNTDQRALYSGYGAELDVVAPGQDILSTGRGNSYLSLSGTSMAAPHVAGLIGLLRSCSPALSAPAARSVIESTADDLGVPGWDVQFGFGRINAHRALARLVQLQPSTDPVRFLIADNAPATLPVTRNFEMVTSDPAVISWTAVITPAASWLSLNTVGETSVSGTGVPMSVTLVATRPTPVVTGRYSTTVLFSAETEGGLALCPDWVEVQLNYVSTARLNYLPIIQKRGLPGPDLVVDSLVAATTGVTVTIRNQGDVAVSDAFWVDVYFNPTQRPALNIPWQVIADHGQVWGVTGDLPPGGSLTLTSGGDYFSPEYSSPLPLPAGATVYALVDSINFNTDYGNVFERNEENNLSGAVISFNQAR